MSVNEAYRILGVSSGASWEEIRQRYRALALRYHPDRNPEDRNAGQRFRQIAKAYEALRQARARAPKEEAARLRRPRVSREDKARVFENFFGIKLTGTPLKQSPGPDFRYDLQIPLRAALQGTEAIITVPRREPCPDCRGEGRKPGSPLDPCPDCQGRGHRNRGPGMLLFGPPCPCCQGAGKIPLDPCSSCRGQGYQTGSRQYRLNIPPGTEHGSRFSLTGEGGAGFKNGPPGNLEVVVHVEPHEFFTRIGNDLYCQVKISFAQAALGGEIRVPTLDGHHPLQVPPGTQPGRVFRFQGAGAPGGPRQPWGDQVVQLVVTTPDPLTSRQKEILEEFARLQQEQLRASNHG